MAFAKWMASGWGRVARIVAGLVLVAFGLYLQGMWGLLVAIIGLAPLAAGAFNVCLFAPAVRRPVQWQEPGSKGLISVIRAGAEPARFIPGNS